MHAFHEDDCFFQCFAYAIYRRWDEVRSFTACISEEDFCIVLFILVMLFGWVLGGLYAYYQDVCMV